MNALQWLSSRPAKGALIILLVCTILLLSGVPRHKDISNVPYEGPSISLDSGLRFKFLSVPRASEHCLRRRLPIYAARNRRRRVYDVFHLHNELSWLDIRLNELYDHVDYFIILESSTTFQGTPKPLHLAENWSRFAPFHEKMVRRTLNSTTTKLDPNDIPARERMTRDALLDIGLASLSPKAQPQQGDVLIMGDVDEIPRPEILLTLRNCAFPARTTLRSSYYHYSFQWRSRGEQWPHPQATYYNGVDTIKPSALRAGAVKIRGEGKGRGNYHDFPNAGWYCNLCRPKLQDIMYTITSASHGINTHPHKLNKGKLLEKVRNGEDVFERADVVLERVDGNGDMPAYVAKMGNRERFAYLLDRDPVDGNFEDAEMAIAGGMVEGKGKTRDLVA